MIHSINGFSQSEQNLAVTLFSLSHWGSEQDTMLDSRLNGGGGPSRSNAKYKDIDISFFIQSRIK